MTAWLDPVRAALEAISTPCPFFFRDDDAGWEDRALLDLLDEFTATGVAVDVAAIPRALSRSCARRLAARADDGLVHVHQHGLAHTNHEREGRTCEFGPARSASEQRLDVARGRVELEHLLGRAIDPVFTPPWNRCTAATAVAAATAGHLVLSRDVSAGHLDQPGLAEVAVTVDWFGHRKRVRWTPDELGRVIADGVTGGGPVGVMLHHAVTDADDRSRIRELLDLVAGSSAAVSTTILDVAVVLDAPGGAQC